MIYLRNLQALFCLSLFALSACTQNPYVNTGTLSVTKPVLPALETTFLIDSPDSIECTENEECFAYVKGYVPDTGNAVLSIEGLPDGATYHPESGKLDYTPNYSVIDLAADPAVTQKTFTLTLVVRSTEDLSRKLTREFPLVVHNAFRPMTANVVGTGTVNEGTAIHQEITLQNLDYPAGPYAVSLENAPAGAQLVSDPGNPLHYTVEYTPGFTTSTLQSPSTSLGLNLVVKTPDGNLLRKSLSWQVNDVRQVPALASSNDLTVSIQNPVFVIQLQDLSQEATPNVSIGQDPAFGALNLTPVAGQAGSFQVQWNGLSAANVGTTTVLSFVTCGMSDPVNQTYCGLRQITVHLIN